MTIRKGVKKVTSEKEGRRLPFRRSNSEKAGRQAVLKLPVNSESIRKLVARRLTVKKQAVSMKASSEKEVT